jgi:hypothetical protein
MLFLKYEKQGIQPFPAYQNPQKFTGCSPDLHLMFTGYSPDVYTGTTLVQYNHNIYTSYPEVMAGTGYV